MSMEDVQEIEMLMDKMSTEVSEVSMMGTEDMSKKDSTYDWMLLDHI